MPIFQTSVLKKFLKQQDEVAVSKAYKAFTAFFHNSEIQQNIKESKEEQFQAKFLDELFVTVLGYTLNPRPKYNLTTEFKNQKGAGKADGAILSNGKAIAVVELKGTKTKDLESVRKQAFDYKANQPECVYVITSNFEKIRFYINNAVDFEEFDLFNLSEERFKLLHLCLQKDNLLKDVPLKIKEVSIVEEESITKKFYADYSLFRRELYRDMVRGNSKNAALKELTEISIKKTLFNKTQKLLDRFLFVFFGEDRLLLPENMITKILVEWEQLKKLNEYRPLYSIFKKHFNYINEGWKTEGYEVFGYNGGLFIPDPILDSIEIDDELLYRHTKKLTGYDFESQIDVNILGHIFEHSLNEIESINAEIEGVEFDKQKTKRKKDGVFYTPKYITKYIVDNTIGKLCEEKKAQLGVVEEEYLKGRKNRPKATISKLDGLLTEYREWMLTLTICDPACGSGAFLNQALDFLINEHCWIDEMRAKLLGGGLTFPDIENSILEKNIYGVDLNEESVEIAKLSLWLRTSQPGRKLTSLNNNIKCGNSLIESKAVAGDKAFVWEKEFPEVFAKGGFDVIIGNPPYVDIKGLDDNIVKELFKRYSTAENRINLYSIFIEKGYNVVKKHGFLSFINPNSILVNSSYTKIRKLLVDDITTIVKLPDGVFEDAIVETIIFEFRKESQVDYAKTVVFPKKEAINHIDESRAKTVKKSDWKESSSCNYNIYVSSEQLDILKKIEKQKTRLEDIADFTLGITPYDKYKGHLPELIKTRGFHSDSKLSEEYVPLISGANILRYSVSNEIKEYLKYGDWLGAPREERFFTEPRVLVRQIVSGNPPRIYAGYTDESLYYTQIGFGIIPKKNTTQPKVVLALLNSNLLNFYHKYRFLDLEKELFQKILIANCKKFPLPTIGASETEIILRVDAILENTKGLQDITGKFSRNLLREFELPKLTKNLEQWDDLSFEEFLQELKKLKVKLTLDQKDEWEDYFLKAKEKAQVLHTKIDQKDREIDQMVYELYGLTEEEIKIVEESL